MSVHYDTIAAVWCLHCWYGWYGNVVHHIWVHFEVLIIVVKIADRSSLRFIAATAWRLYEHRASQVLGPEGLWPSAQFCGLGSWEHG